MLSILRSLGFAALANVASLGLAAALLDGFCVRLGGLLVAVLVFTVLAVALRSCPATASTCTARWPGS